MTPNRKVAIVTGGGRGLGEAICGRFAKAGWSVLVVDRDAAAAERVAAELTDKGLGAQAFAVDLRSEDAPQRVADAALAAFQRIDALVNNAGIAPLVGFFDTTRADVRELMDVNFEMQFFLTQAVARQMITQGEGGCIINIGTIHSEIGIQRGSAYAASKAALTAWSRTLAVELAPHRIRVNTIAPGPIATARVRNMLSAEEIAARESRIPVGRMGEESDIAGCALFLASEDAGFITGQLLVVDGGLTISANF